MTPFLPPLDSMWRLATDVPLRSAMLNAYYNSELRANLGASAGDNVFSKGTIIRFERYHISRSGEDQITIMILTSPDARICPKKMGGKARGKGRVYLWLDDINALGDMEAVDVLD